MSGTDLKSVLPLAINESFRNWYRGAFGKIYTHTKASYTGEDHSSRISNRRPTAEIKVLMVILSFMTLALEIRLENFSGRLSRTLNVYPVMDHGSAVFRMCKSGNIDGLQASFSAGVVSPFVIDRYGRTLLHVSV